MSIDAVLLVFRMMANQFATLQLLVAALVQENDKEKANGAQKVGTASREEPSSTSSAPDKKILELSRLLGDEKLHGVNDAELKPLREKLKEDDCLREHVDLQEKGTVDNCLHEHGTNMGMCTRS